MNRKEISETYRQLEQEGKASEKENTECFPGASGNHAAAQVLRGRALLRQGRLTEAMAVLREADRDDGFDAPYYLGCALARRREWTLAEAAFTRAVELDSDGRAYVQRGHVHLRRGTLAAAAGDYRNAAAKGSRSAAAAGLQAVGRCYASRHRPDRALRMLEIAESLTPLSAENRWLAGWCCYLLGRLDRCAGYWEEWSGDLVRRVRTLQGVRSTAAADWSAAVLYWQQAAAMGTPVQEDLAEAYFRSAASSPRSGEASESLRAAAALLPRDSRAIYYLALSTALAVSLETALRLIGGHQDCPRILVLAGLLQHAAGDAGRACSLWRRAGAPAYACLVLSFSANGDFSNLRKIARDDNWPEAVLYDLLWSCGAGHAAAARWEPAAQALRYCLRMDLERAAHIQYEPATALSAATIYLLAGFRQEAQRLLRPVQRAYPHDARITRFLLVSHYWDAEHGARAENAAAALTARREMTRNAVLLLHHPGFWKSWCDGRSAVYGSGLRVGQETAFRRLAEESLLARVAITTGEGMAFRIELGGARALERAGGLRVPTLAEPLIGGLAMLRELHCSGLLGQVALERSVGGDLGDDGRLRRYFSQLAAAQALVDFDRPGDALTALGHAACARCAAAVPSGPWLPRVCRSECSSFDYLNPAYQCLPERGVQLARDAVRLSMEAHLAVAIHALAAPSIRREAVEHGWGEAVRLEISTAWDAVRLRIVNDSCGWARNFLDGDRLDDAVWILETALEVCGSKYLALLAGPLSQAANRRGVVRFDRDEFTAALSDFRRARELNPHVPIVLRNLAVCLSRVVREYSADQPEEARRFYRQAGDVLREAETLFPGELWIEQQRGILQVAGGWLGS